jgi:two-component system KDP operon response regulator KdpE
VKPNPIVLLIDDDKASRRMLRILLVSQHYQLHETGNGKLGLAAAGTCRPDLIILELALPDMDGLTVLKRLRRSRRTPVLVVSARNCESDTVAALDGGADDYVIKPFSETELLARLRVLRRCIAGEFEEPILIEGDLKMDLTSHLVTLSGRKIKLTHTEEALLHVLVAYAGKVVSPKHLLRSVWGTEGEHQARCLSVFMSMLRRKLEVTRGRVAIETVENLGYRLLLDGGDGIHRDIDFASGTIESQNDVPHVEGNDSGQPDCSGQTSENAMAQHGSRGSTGTGPHFPAQSHGPSYRGLSRQYYFTQGACGEVKMRRKRVTIVSRAGK